MASLPVHSRNDGQAYNDANFIVNCLPFMVMNVIEGSPNHIRLTEERTGGWGPWKRLGDWVCGTLFLFALGYHDQTAFIASIHEAFVSRLKSTANPRIIRELSRGPGRRIEAGLLTSFNRGRVRAPSLYPCQLGWQVNEIGQ